MLLVGPGPFVHPFVQLGFSLGESVRFCFSLLNIMADGSPTGSRKEKRILLGVLLYLMF